jgi:hypothetical protein
VSIFATPPRSFSPYSSPQRAGTRKRRRMRLRASMRDRSRHFSTFRSGLFIGVSLPAIISGIYGSKVTALSYARINSQLTSRLARSHSGCHSCVVGVTASECQISILLGIYFDIVLGLHSIICSGGIWAPSCIEHSHLVPLSHKLCVHFRFVHLFLCKLLSNSLLASIGCQDCP